LLTLGANANEVIIWGKPKNLKRSLVISRFDDTNFGVIAQLTDGVHFSRRCRLENKK
jgi:hypothetical protein